MAVATFLKDAALHPSVQGTVDDIIRSRPSDGISPDLVKECRKLVLHILDYHSEALPRRTAKAASPIRPEILWAWGEVTDDPDSATLAEWVLKGAPLGFSDPICSTGIFPVVSGQPWFEESANALVRDLESWANYSSAVEEESALRQLVQESLDAGFCTIYDSLEQATADLHRTPLLNKLGVIVKEKESGRKCRIIWDLRESGINKLCHQGERVILPKLVDTVHDALNIYRSGGRPRFLAVDILNAFHNVPAGRDRSFTVAAFHSPSGWKVLCYDVLVFGSVSSPTIWGRFAAWLSRTLVAVCPGIGLQTYVDDPIITFDHSDPLHRSTLGSVLLWFAITGFPIKYSKAEFGDQVKWIGATLQAMDEEKAIKVSIPQEKLEDLKSRCISFLSRPVIGRKQLRSFTGSLSFLGGIVPYLRPFLASLWAAVSQANDKGQPLRRLVHTKRVGQALDWVLTFLHEERILCRVVRAVREKSNATIITDASTKGMGAVLFVGTEPMEYFSVPIPSEFILRFQASTGDPKHMSPWESLCLLVAARIWLVRYPIGSTARVRADNLAALYMIKKCKAKSPDLAAVARELALDQALEDYEFTLLSHIDTKSNVLADALSRQFEDSPEPFPPELAKCKRVAVKISPSFWRVKQGKYSKSGSKRQRGSQPLGSELHRV